MRYYKEEIIVHNNREFFVMWQHRECYPERITVCVDTRERPFLCVVRTGALMYQVFRIKNCEWIAEEQLMGDLESITPDELIQWFDPIPYDDYGAAVQSEFGLMKIPAEALLQMARKEVDDCKVLISGYEALVKSLQSRLAEFEKVGIDDEDRAARIQAKAMKKVDMDYAGLKERNKALKKENNRLKREKTDLLARLNRL